MNREILYRGKQINNEKWHYGDLLKFGNKRYINICPRFVDEYIVEEDKIALYSFGNFIEVIPETVGQYIELTDKNGLTIFEGDIIKWHDEWIDCDFVGVVEFDHCSAAFKIRVGNELISLLDYEYTIKIGNIHDNLEMLK